MANYEQLPTAAKLKN